MILFGGRPVTLVAALNLVRARYDVLSREPVMSSEHP
jgi:hypothetical protein